jgi:hypothetical protein
VNIRFVLKKLQGVLRFCLGLISYVVPKQKDVIVFCSDRYNENSRYLFEYMVDESIADVYWLSYSAEITGHLKQMEYPVLDKWWHQIWILMRASVVVCSGNSFWDRYGAVSKPTIKYCLMHGCGPKVTEYYNNFDYSLRILKQVNDFDYVNFPSKFSADVIGKCIFKLPTQKIVVNGYPRHDHLFSSDSLAYVLARKEIISMFGIDVESDSRFVFYSPTFRKYNNAYAFPISNLVGYDPAALIKFLKDNSIYLFYFKHPQTIIGAVNQLPTGPNFIEVSYSASQALDITKIMPGFDALINDYSTTGVDYSILQRPQYFVIPDFVEFSQNDAFVEDYLEAINQLPVADFDSLLARLVGFDSPPPLGFYKYFDCNMKGACNRNSQFIRGL